MSKEIAFERFSHSNNKNFNHNLYSKHFAVLNSAETVGLDNRGGIGVLGGLILSIQFTKYTLNNLANESQYS